MSKLFAKNVENFVCENCGHEVCGNGYTNHCPKCLFSKHVDINPGDRQNLCGGLMAPIRIEKKGDKMSIIHKCQKCGNIHKNKTSQNDSFSAILEVMKKVE